MAIKVKEIPPSRACPSCGNQLDIVAEHSYEITQQEDGSWHKEIGKVVYMCGNCSVYLHIDEIADILKQVDEL